MYLFMLNKLCLSLSLSLSCIIHHGMYVALWEGIVDFFKFEISNFMLDTSNIFVISNTDINSKKVSYL